MESWKDKKEKLCFLIKEVSDFYGGDDIEFLREYCKAKIDEYKDNLDIIIDCFEDLRRYCKK